MPMSRELAPDVMSGHSCCSTCDDGNVLPVGPFVSNNYHFGMLLGVADLETDQGYHRGKTWLHQAWQHGEGVVWGLQTLLRAASSEIVVAPGLAVNAAGREAYLDREHCVDIAEWFAKEPHDDLEVNTRADGAREFIVHITISPRICVDRPVPAISEPCTNSDVDIAYSRAVEAAQLAVVPNAVPPRAEPYPKLRQLAGLIPVTDPEIADAIAEIAAETPDARPERALGWLRNLAADDVTAQVPDSAAVVPFPTGAEAAVVIAEVVVVLLPGQNGAMTITDTGADASVVDIRVRPALIATTTIAELLCGTLAGATPAVGGPQIDPDSLTVTATEVSVVASAALEPLTVDDTTVTVTAFAAGAWQPVATTAALDADGVTIRAALTAPLASLPIRVIVTGTGPTPVMGTSSIPLAGVAGRPVNPDDHGTDAVLILRS